MMSMMVRSILMMKMTCPWKSKVDSLYLMVRMSIMYLFSLSLFYFSISISQSPHLSIYLFPFFFSQETNCITPQ
ncbi:hypothetical protein CLU79DRAFT_770305 [Phycomyces nitens]|nr:hypothetical protein CLU79DRAFT_770305 [Phycomyces nitens]